MNEAQAQSIIGGLAAREKYWHERSADERIAALAETLAYVLRENHKLQETVYHLRRHRHGTDGALMVPLLKEGDERNYRPTEHYLDRIGYGQHRE